MTDLLHRIESAIAQRRLLAPGQKVLIAVSGGVDSMVLLHGLCALSRRHHWKLVVAHFDHQLRGRTSRADAQFVRRTAAALKLKFITGHAAVNEIAAQSKLSTEMAARKVRHEFLACAARDNKVPTIALAHHADDQVEQFFLRLFRGAGGEGIAGMKWRSPSPADKAITLVRPLLDCAKGDLVAYARAHKVRFREDATNSSSDFLRNRIRNELLPLLRKKYQPGLDKIVLRLMNIVGSEAEFVRAAAENHFSSQRQQAHAGAGDFDRLPVAVQRKVLQQQLASLELIPDFELVEQLRSFPDRRVNVGVGLSVSRGVSGKVRFQEQFAAEFNSAALLVTLEERKGRVKFAGRRFDWHRKPVKRFELPARLSGHNRAKILECFDAGAIGDRIVLRHWRPGDRFQPIGLKSAAKLQDLFVNAKIPAARRRELVLATTGKNEIFWVEGLRIGERFKLTPQTRQMLVWERHAV